jgi:pimeloyl-ACP methyl ester carboxylesterase
VRERGWNHEHLDVNDIRIHYVRHGAGFPLVLLHGWPEFWYVFRKNVPPLSEGFDVVVPDLRGFGETEKPPLPDPRRPCSATSSRTCAGSRTPSASSGSGW